MAVHFPSPLAAHESRTNSAGVIIQDREHSIQEPLDLMPPRGFMQSETAIDEHAIVQQIGGIPFILMPRSDLSDYDRREVQIISNQDAAGN